MVRALDSAIAGTIEDRSRFVPRNFVWVTAKNRDTGLPESMGFWDEPETVSVTVLSGVDGTETTRTYIGGAIVEIDPIPLTIGLEIQTIEVRLNTLHPDVEELVRGLDPRLASVEVHRGHYDPDTMLLVAPPVPRFLGQVNGTPISTPAVGGESSLPLRVVSHTRGLTRTNPAKKSDEAQRRRSGDRFRRYNSMIAEIPIAWGEANETPAPPVKNGLFGWGFFGL